MSDGWILCRHEWKGIHGERHVCDKPTSRHRPETGTVVHECACGLPLVVDVPEAVVGERGRE